MSAAGLSRNVVASIVTAGLSIGSALFAVPLIVDRVGTAGFGVWTVAQSLVLLVVVGEAGIGSGVQRFVARARGAAERRAVGRLLWTSLGLYALAGALAILLGLLLAPLLVDVFDPPARLRAGAEDTFRLTGVLFAAALLASALANVQQGLERFGSFALSTAVSVPVYLIALVALVGEGDLAAVAVAAIAQQAALALARAVTVLDVLREGRPSLLPRAERRALLGFAARMQLSATSTVANTQADKLIVGLIAPAATVGQLGIGSQLAQAGRLVSGSALSPMTARMAALHGSADHAELERLYPRVERMWLTVVLGGTAIGAATLPGLVEAWLGEGYGEAALFGCILVLAFGVNLLPGVSAVYLRAIGRPSIEARYALLILGLNLALTIGLGLAVGAVGVVVATLAAYCAGSAWFFARSAPVVPRSAGSALPTPRSLAVLVLAALASTGWALAWNELLPAGWALVPVALGMAAAFVGYLSFATGKRPTRAAARELLRAAPQRPAGA